MSARRPHILIEDVTFMLAAGEHPWRIAQRLDMTLAAMSRALRRAGRHPGRRYPARNHADAAGAGGADLRRPGAGHARR